MMDGRAVSQPDTFLVWLPESCGSGTRTDDWGTQFVGIQSLELEHSSPRSLTDEAGQTGQNGDEVTVAAQNIPIGRSKTPSRGSRSLRPYRRLCVRRLSRCVLTIPEHRRTEREYLRDAADGSSVLEARRLSIRCWPTGFPAHGSPRTHKTHTYPGSLVRLCSRLLMPSRAARSQRRRMPSFR